MMNIGRIFSKAMQGLGFKMLMALAGAALPALAVAAILGMTLVREVGEAETDFNHASSAALELSEMLVLVEKEHGLIARLPAELDLGRIEAYAQQIAGLGQEFETEIAELVAIQGIVSPEVISEIRATRQQMKGTAEAIVQATKSYAQTTALDLVDGPYEESTKVLRTLIDAIGSNVDGVVEHARNNLRASSRQAWILTPIALIGALCATVFGIWMVRRNFVLPVARLTEHVLRIRESGNLDVPPESRILGRDDEIGTLSRSFNLMISDLGNASQRLIASEAETRTQYERLDVAINNMPQGLCMFDAEHKLIICNKRYADIYGLPPEHMVPGTALQTILQHRVKNNRLQNADEFIESRLAIIAENKPFYHVSELSDGRVIAISHQPMPGGGLIATHEDITERRKAEAQIAYMAHHDALTDLPNRVRFREEMAKALGRVDRGETLAVLCIDLDHFKTVNDTLGHPVGDALLQAASDRLRACVRSTDTVARLGGDEFAIVQVGSDQPVGATELATRLVKEIGQPFDVQGHQVVIGTSVGIAIAPNDGKDPDQLLKGADLALYRAKEDGRGTFRFFEPDMDARMQARRALELDLRKALALGEFEVFYQPFINLERNEVCGFEALLRWRHPQRGLVPPAEFIPLTEEIGLIGAIGAWVLKQACIEAATWPSSIRIAVNLSPVQFKGGTLVLDVIAALGTSGLSAQRLELEITETVLLQDTDTTVSTLNQLRDLGVRISMDDFGTGYSSLGYLRKFPFDKIKIDQSFIRDIANGPDSIAIVRAVTGLGSSLGISTTAEGVETEAQLAQLRSEGCTEVQGYLFSKPVPASEIGSLLHRLESEAKVAA
jgi:diguanylate cyclase (GGDEF)-like protein/PAS domain S-box-containing protein